MIATISKENVPRESLSKKIRATLSKMVQPKEKYDKIPVRRYFKGKTLVEVLQRDREVKPEAEIPLIVERLISLIRIPKFLKEEGILRLSGLKQKVSEMQGIILISH
jgi:hypothetical protein